MPAGLTMGGILIMVAESASRADDFLFCCHVGPLFDNLADLPRDKNNTSDDHQDGNLFSCIRQGDNVPETYGCQCHNRKIKGITKIVHIWI